MEAFRYYKRQMSITIINHSNHYIVVMIIVIISIIIIITNNIIARYHLVASIHNEEKVMT